MLYRGQVMEQGAAPDVYAEPGPPVHAGAARGGAGPRPDGQRRRRAARARRAAAGAPAPERSCPFAPRCPHAIDVCRSERPRLEVTPAGTLVACHRWRELTTTQTAV